MQIITTINHTNSYSPYDRIASEYHHASKLFKSSYEMYEREMWSVAT